MEYLFEVMTPLGFSVRTTVSYWEKLVSKHPELKDRLEDVKKALKEPVEVRKSKTDELVFLFYLTSEKYWITSVAKKEEDFGFLITAYLTDKMKEGKKIWPK